MSGLETAIRNALARSERGNAEVRERIYQSARNALEAGLRKQEVTDPQAITAQRYRLETTIREIETEEREALAAPVTPRDIEVDPISDMRPEPAFAETRQHAAVAPEPRVEARAEPVVSVEPPAVSRADDRVEPVVTPLRREPQPVATDEAEIDGLRAERTDGFDGRGKQAKKTAAVEQTRVADFKPERVAKARKRRGRLFSFLLVVATLAVAGGALAWWVDTSGILQQLQNDDGSNPPTTVSGGSFSGEDPLKKALDTQSRFTSDWLPVFSPDDTAGLSAGTAARFESVSTGEGPAARITSTAPDRNGAVEIAVSPEVLRQLGGKTSTVALSIKTSNEKPAQVSVECEFGTMGGCGRHRFTVSERTDILFRVTFDGSLLPSTPGHLVLNTDIAGGDASVNLYAVRILPGE